MIFNFIKNLFQLIFFSLCIILSGCVAIETRKETSIDLAVYGMKELSHLTFDTSTNTFSNKRIIDTSDFGFGVMHKNQTIYSTGNGITASTWKSDRFEHGATENSFGLGTHISLDPTGQFVASASFRSGNTVVYSIKDDGSLDKETALVLKSTDKSWAHWTGWNNTGNYLYTVLMADNKIVAYPFDSNNATVGSPIDALHSHASDWPRHIAFSPNSKHVYIVNQKSNTLVMAYTEEDGQFTPIQTISLLPDDYSGESHAAHIQVSQDGQYVYVSNRGQKGASSSLAIFQMTPNESPSNSYLKLVDHEVGSSEFPIDTPRVFLLIDHSNLLFVANQSQGNILAFRVEGNGELTLLDSSQPTVRPFYLLERP